MRSSSNIYSTSKELKKAKLSHSSFKNVQEIVQPVVVGSIVHESVLVPSRAALHLNNIKFSQVC